MIAKGLLPLAGTIVAIMLAGFSSCFSPESVIEVETMQVKRGNISDVISASGKVAPDQTEAVVSDTNGEIGEILVEEGDNVITDQILISFKQPEPVKSPVAGTVLGINCARGQMAAVGTPLITFGQQDPYLIISKTGGEIKEKLVKAGDKIIKGQELLNFVQPKPELSPKTGTISELNCAIGQIVTPGTPLMIIEDDVTEINWVVVSDIYGEIEDVLVEEQDYVVKDEVVVKFTLPEPVTSPVEGKILNVDCLKGQMIAIGTPLMTVGDEDTYMVTSDTNGEINEILVEIGDVVAKDQEVVDFVQPEPVKSPIDGRVAEDNSLKGQMVTVGTPLMVIADVSPFYVAANVEEADIAMAQVGQTASITLDAYPDITLEGRVTKINFSAVNTPVGGTEFPVEVEILSSNGLDLRLGMTADIEIAFENHADVIIVPQKAVVRRSGRDVVFIVADSKAQAREVELGICTDDFCEIRSGLAEGEEIVTDVASVLEGGEKVAPAGSS